MAFAWETDKERDEREELIRRMIQLKESIKRDKEDLDTCLDVLERDIFKQAIEAEETIRIGRYLITKKPQARVTWDQKKLVDILDARFPHGALPAGITTSTTIEVDENLITTLPSSDYHTLLNAKVAKRIKPKFIFQEAAEEEKA
jgi:hypothetical protein